MGTGTATKRQIAEGPGQDVEEEDIEAKKRRVLEETRAIDAASDSESEESESDSEDEEDETAELLRELEKIKKERADRKEQEEKERAGKEQEQRESDIAYGNPLLNPNRDAETKRRWDDDVVFRNQARGTEKKGKPEFVNDLLRSDFHKRFMVCSKRSVADRALMSPDQVRSLRLHCMLRPICRYPASHLASSKFLLLDPSLSGGQSESGSASLGSSFEYASKSGSRAKYWSSA